MVATARVSEESLVTKPMLTKWSRRQLRRRLRQQVNDQVDPLLFWQVKRQVWWPVYLQVNPVWWRIAGHFDAGEIQ